MVTQETEVLSVELSHLDTDDDEYFHPLYVLSYFRNVANQDLFFPDNWHYNAASKVPLWLLPTELLTTKE